MSLVFLRTGVERTDHEAHETLLAEPIGNSLYELKSIPKFITTLNYGDIVKAENDPLTISKVIAPSGYQTFRIVFLKGTNEKVHREVVHSLSKWHAVGELIYIGLYAVSVAPEGDIQAIRGYLSDLKQRKRLLYEPDTPLDHLFLALAENK
jgi:hypothetical protein